MSDYETRGYMSSTTDVPLRNCFLSHHAVIKEARGTTKTRVVFHANTKTSSGLSLNDVLI